MSQTIKVCDIKVQELIPGSSTDKFFINIINESGGETCIETQFDRNVVVDEFQDFRSTFPRSFASIKGYISRGKDMETSMQC